MVGAVAGVSAVVGMTTSHGAVARAMRSAVAAAAGSPSISSPPVLPAGAWAPPALGWRWTAEKPSTVGDSSRAEMSPRVARFEPILLPLMPRMTKCHAMRSSSCTSSYRDVPSSSASR